MARLPNVGGDDGTWGDVLNDFLVQSHNADGALKAGSVGAPQLKPNAVTGAAIANGSISNAKIADGAVGSAQISDGAINENHLATDVQSKLNAPLVLANGSVSEGKLDSAVQAKLNAGVADESITTSMLADDAVTIEKLKNAGASNGPAILDGTGTLLATTVPMQAVADSTELQTTYGIPLKLAGAWWDVVFAAPAAEDVPQISVATASTLSGTTIAPTADMEFDPHFRYDGCIGVTSPAVGWVAPAPSAVGVQYYCNEEFVTDASNSVVEIPVMTTAAGGKIGVRVLIDGKPHAVELQRFSIGALTTYYVKIAFPTARARRLLVEVEGIARVGGVVVPTGQTVYRPEREIQKPIGILADSFGRGAGWSTGGASGLETFGYYLGRLLGADRLVNFSIGGTGWVSAGSAQPFGTRTPEILSSGVTALVALGSRNDNGAVSSVFAAVRAALSQLQTIPALWVGGPAQSAFASVNAEVRHAAAAASRSFIDVLDVITPGERTWTDGIHPSHAGHVELAKAFYAGIDTRNYEAKAAAAAAARFAPDLTLTASPSTAQATGSQVMLTGTLSTHRAGRIAFLANGVEIGNANVTAGVANVQTSTLTAGAYTITARFVPQSPSLVRAVVSNSMSYTISANLGFTAGFDTARSPVTATDNGKPYTIYGLGTWDASSGKLMNAGVTSGLAAIVADAGTPSGACSVTISGATVNAAMLLLRYVTQINHLRLAVQSGQITLQQVISNATTTLYTGTGGGWAAGDVISVVLSDDTISVKKNGVSVPGLTDVTVSQFNTATKFGVGHYSSGVGVTYDNLSFVA